MTTVINLWPLWLLLAIAIFLKYIRPYVNGYIGEVAVRFILCFLNKKQYKILNNLTLYYEGKKAQIDHVVISVFGVFVIETKNYKGVILGNDYTYYWTQVLYKSRYQLYNPILQNKVHVRALKKVLDDYNNINYISIIVFTWKARLRITTNSNVIKYYRLYWRIRSYKQPVLTNAMVEEIYTLLKQRNKVKYKPTTFFLDDTILQIEPSINNVLPNLCPRCKHDLVPRRGRYGAFNGCSNFPICRYTEKKKN